MSTQVVWPLNENGEIVFSAGTGSGSVTGYLNQDILPSADDGSVPVRLVGVDTSAVSDRLRAGRIENKVALRNLLAELYSTGQSPRLMTVVTDGDSVSPRVGEHVAIGLRERYGDGGVVYPIQSNTANYGDVTVVSSITGSVTQGSVGDSSYNYLPNNAHFILQNGATLNFRAQNNHATFSRILAWLVKRPGDGSALLEVRRVSDNVVVASWNTGSLDGVDGALVKANGGAHFTGLDSTIAYELKITATGTVCFLTAAFLRDSGIVIYQAGLGGSPLAKQIPAIQGGAWSGIMSDLNCRLMLHEDKTEDFGASYAAHIAAWQQMPNISCLYIGSLPDSTDASNQIAVISSLRDKVLAAGMAFIDGYTVLKDYNELTRLGLNNDGTHALTAAYWMVANFILSEIVTSDQRLGLLLETPVRASEYRVFRGDGYGNQSKAISFARQESGVNRVNLWNINYLGFKSNQTESTDSPLSQVRMQSYSNYGVSFLSASGQAAWLNNIGGIAFGTASGSGNSSAQLTMDYNNARVNFSLTTSAGVSVSPVVDCGGIRVSGSTMLTAKQAAISAPSGGSTVDAEARATINSIRAALTALGLTA